jgi:hypothetical protein
MQLGSDLLALVALGSAVLFAASAVAVPIFLARAPADVLLAPPRSPAWLRVIKNLLGGGLLMAGLAMLVLPGQGLLTLLLAVMLLEFPGKRRLLRRLVGQPRLRRSIDALRRRAGRPPIDLGEDDA